MKQKVFTFAVALATIMLLLLPFTPPHHHHNGVVCNVVEHCNKDNATNDIHTHHHGDTSSCVEESEYIAPRVGVQRVVIAPVQFLPLFSLLPSIFFAILSALVSKGRRYGRMCIPHYVSPQHTIFALRAPPFLS
jgi:hypothetical protein